MANDTSNKWKDNYLGGLYIQEGKSGKYLKGRVTINGQVTPIIVFKNTKKTEDKFPDYNIYKAEDRPQNSAPAVKQPVRTVAKPVSKPASVPVVETEAELF